MDFAKWKIEGIFKADATKCSEEIKSLEQITPENVLEYARDEESELHKCFEWNDSAAAEKYRLHQARQVIQMITIVPKKEVANNQKVRMFQIAETRNTYEPTRHFLSKPDSYALLLERAKTELYHFRNRYKMLSELENVFAEIDAM